MKQKVSFSLLLLLGLVIMSLLNLNGCDSEPQKKGTTSGSSQLTIPEPKNVSSKQETISFIVDKLRLYGTYSYSDKFDKDWFNKFHEVREKHKEFNEFNVSDTGVLEVTYSFIMKEPGSVSTSHFKQIANLSDLDAQRITIKYNEEDGDFYRVNIQCLNDSKCVRHDDVGAYSGINKYWSPVLTIDMQNKVEVDKVSKALQHLITLFAKKPEKF